MLGHAHPKRAPALVTTSLLKQSPMVHTYYCRALLRSTHFLRPIEA